MNIQVISAKESEKPILKRLMELYCYDFSEYTGEDLDEKGEYGYQYLNAYWIEENRHPFFIKVDEKYAGFVLVNQHGDVYQHGEANCMAEFFVMRKYRRQGIGEKVAHQILAMFPGKWEVAQDLANPPSVIFWDKVIGDQYEKEEVILKTENRRVLILTV